VGVLVRWNKQEWSVDVDAAQPSLDLFKAQIQSLSSVPVDRQKLIVKGRQLKTDEDLSKLSEGTKVMLMGSAEVIAAAPETKVVFEEDLTDAQKVSLVPTVLPAGLQNLGNTCYLASTLQCFRAIVPLKEALKEYAVKPAAYGATSADFGRPVAHRMGALFSEMDSSTKPVVPFGFITVFRQQFPQFDERTREGVHMQQDADESFSQILHLLCESVRAGSSLPDGARGLFEGNMISRLKCLEDPSDIGEDRIEPFFKLRCHITEEVNFLSDGIKRSLVEEIEKNSPVLGRNAKYSRESRIIKLPEYLPVQFVRFFWRTDTQKKSKILRKVTFPIRFDVFQFCDESLQKQLSEHRNKVDLAVESSSSPQDAMEIDAPGSSGVYELCAVITHKGRSADSGHYIGWTRDSGEDWFQFDDDKVSRVKEEDVLKLSGGGDWHMAYILFYRAAPWRPPK